ncbi:MAG: OmpA family protein [Elusimicrobia bacterium]|nr:OmpA family protein [Elusimicrobiota bacterium]
MNEDLTQLWMVPYADLMSTLVLLFMCLFAASYSSRSPEYDRALAHVEKEMSSGPQADRRFDETELAVQIKREMARLRLSDFGVRVTSRQVRLTLPNPVLFDEGSATLSPDAGAVLAPLARLFSKCGNPILIEGHTDDVRIVGGRLRSNWELSAARSFAVVGFLMTQGLPAERFNARGYGQYRPVATNLTAEGRLQNRRIEISLIREIKKEG